MSLGIILQTLGAHQCPLPLTRLPNHQSWLRSLRPVFQFNLCSGVYPVLLEPSAWLHRRMGCISRFVFAEYFGTDVASCKDTCVFILLPVCAYFATVVLHCVLCHRYCQVHHLYVLDCPVGSVSNTLFVHVISVLVWDCHSRRFCRLQLRFISSHVCRLLG
eukprot:PhF_6_TR9222/c0_g1_i2/m.14505